MRTTIWPEVMLLFLIAAPAAAQEVIGDREVVAVESTESWAMSYMAGTTFLTSFGPTPSLAAWQWTLAGEAGSIPALSAQQREVGFGGSKVEDLNKSPVFGRLRGAVGLPGRLVLEVAYTPPLTINGVQPHGVAGIALGRRWWSGESFSLSTRVFAQRGYVQGDITCPRELAGIDDPQRNPYGCEAPSRDQLRLHYRGLDATAGWQRGEWTSYASAGWVRAPLSVQVDALTYGFRDRTFLEVRHNMHFFTLGAGHPLAGRWHWVAEAMYVPLRVQRGSSPSRTDSLLSVRMQLSYRFGER